MKWVLENFHVLPAMLLSAFKVISIVIIGSVIFCMRNLCYLNDNIKTLIRSTMHQSMVEAMEGRVSSSIRGDGARLILDMPLRDPPSSHHF